MSFVMNNLTKLSYHFTLCSLCFFLTQCGGQENLSEDQEAPVETSRDGFTCDGGKEIAVRYINDGYCDCEDGSDEREPCEDIVEEPSFFANAYCTGGKVNMRSSPEIDDNIVGRLEEYQAVRVLDDITGNDPDAGVMKRNYTVIYDGSDVPAGKLSKGQAVRIVGSYQGYDGLDQEYVDLLHLETIERGRKVIYEWIPRSYFRSYYGQTWYKVETEEGERGWVSGEYIEFD